MHKGKVENVSSWVVNLLENMLSCWHAVTLAPICFPLTKDGESRLNSEFNSIIVSESIWGWDVSNEVPVIKASNVSREISFHALNSIRSNTRVPVLVIDSSKFSFNSSCFIKDIVVFINKNVAPVGNLEGSLDFSENGKRTVVFIMNEQRLKAECLNILERTIL